MLLKGIAHNFKGIKDGEIEFYYPVTVISGPNGSGKSTWVNAWFWVTTNTDYSGRSNPDVRPIGCADEESTSVEFVIYHDEHEVSFMKTQKLKRTGEKIALTNIYEFNSVPMPERDFQKKLQEVFGVDQKKFLFCSHTDAALADTSKKGREALRALLFSMAGNMSDKDVAEDLHSFSPIEELKSYLQFYSLEEIKAMMTATRKKVVDVYGKSGELIDAAIEGALSGKVTVDVAALRAEEAEIRSRIESLANTGEDSRKVELRKRLEGLKDKRRALESKIREGHRKRADEIAAEVRKWSLEKANIEARIRNIEIRISEGDKTEETYKKKLEVLRDEYAAEANKEYVPQETCQVCGQMLPKSIIDGMRESFERAQSMNIAKIEKDAEVLASLIEEARSRAKAARDERVEAIRGLGEADAKMKAARKEGKDLPLSPIYGDDPEYSQVEKEIEETEAALRELEAGDGADRIKEITRLNRRLEEISRSLGADAVNRRIDERVEALRCQKVVCAQQLADAEKILHQVEQLERHKNGLLELEVNKHFKVVEWKLFRTLKNGTYESTCIPTVDGKELGSSMNTALEVTAKLDIVRSLQEFYGVKLPVWLDNAEHLDSGSLGKIKSWGLEMVILKVSDAYFGVHAW